MERRPLDHQRMRSTRELTSDHIQRINSVYSFRFPVLSVKM
jgi:hypothetical protein